MRASFGFAAGLLLCVIDLVQALHRVLKGRSRRAFHFLLIAVLGSLTLTSLTSLIRITSDMKVLTTDNMVGVESATDMRHLVSGLQLEYLRGGLVPALFESTNSIHREFTRLHEKYLTGVFEQEDRNNATSVREAAELYFESLQSLAKTGMNRPEAVDVSTVDLNFRRLLVSLDRALTYNNRRLHASADEAESNANKALQISNRIWWTAIGLLIIIIAVMVLDTWWTHVVPKATRYPRNSSDIDLRDESKKRSL